MDEPPSATTAPADGGLAARVRAARGRSFVGRRTELELFRAALSAELPPFAVLHLHGPGGIGKTALLRRLLQEAVARERSVVLLDGREMAPSPAGFSSALGAALGVASEQAVAALASHHRPVLLVDTYEQLTPLDGWLRDRLIPQLPEAALLVIASRNAPSAAWLADPAWHELLRVVALRDLSADDARALLETRGIASRHDEALRVTRGHPLALILVAEVLEGQHDDAPLVLDNAPAVFEGLLKRLLRQVPSATHRYALHVAAHAGIATEALLRQTVDDASAREIFDWLGELSFTEAVAGGIALHALISDALNAELRWRDPDGFVALHEAVTHYLQGRVGRTVGDEQHRAMLDSLQLYRHHPTTNRFYDWTRTQELWLDSATLEDHEAIIVMARAHEGDASAELVAYWLDRQPEAFTVFRGSSSSEPAGFVTHLLLGDTPDGETEIDPVAAAVWDHVRANAPIRDGERLRIMRFWIDRETYQDVATHHLVSIRSSLDWVGTEDLAWSFVVLARADFYEPIFTFIDFQRPPKLEVSIGERTYGMFARDWRSTSRQQWRKLLLDRRTSSSERLLASPDHRDRLLVLAHTDFTDAVRDALRGLARPEGLDGNPLLRCRVVVEASSCRPVADALAHLLAQAADDLSAHPRGEKIRRVLELTYFRPAPTQRAAAERLDLPFSTFRRHLSRGVDHTASWLWERELHGSPGAPSPPGRL